MFMSYGGKTVDPTAYMNSADAIYFRKRIAQYYRQLTNKKSPYKYNTLRVSVDSRHKDCLYSYFIVCKGGKVYLAPIIFSNDGIQISGSSLPFGSKKYKLYQIELTILLYSGSTYSQLGRFLNG